VEGQQWEKNEGFYVFVILIWKILNIFSTQNLIYPSSRFNSYEVHELDLSIPRLFWKPINIVCGLITLQCLNSGFPSLFSV
jgi:hypothetical protein